MAKHPLAAWLEEAGPAAEGGDEPEETTPEPRGRPSRRLLALAALPWAAVLGVLAWPADEAPPPTEASTAGPAAPDAPPALAAEPAAPAHATALAAVREHAGGETRYVDLAAVEGVEATALGDVVRVLVVVLEGDGEAWTDERVERWAAAVADDGALRDAPWRLPDAPAAEERPVEWRGEADPAPAEEALRAAGLDDAEEVAVTTTPEADGIVRAAFVADGEERAAWVRLEPEPRLLGTAPATARRTTRRQETR